MFKHLCLIAGLFPLVLETFGNISSVSALGKNLVPRRSLPFSLLSPEIYHRKKMSLYISSTSLLYNFAIFLDHSVFPIMFFPRDLELLLDCIYSILFFLPFFLFTIADKNTKYIYNFFTKQTG